MDFYLWASPAETTAQENGKKVGVKGEKNTWLSGQLEVSLMIFVLPDLNTRFFNIVGVEKQSVIAGIRSGHNTS